VPASREREVEFVKEGEKEGVEEEEKDLWRPARL